MHRFVLITLAGAALCGPALAQDNAAPSNSVTLPPICGTQPEPADSMAGMDHNGMAMAPDPAQTSQKAMTGDIDEAHQDLMAGMDEMQAQMMAGMQAPDIDVAFVCGMIPHHMGAIAMAKAELKHGKDEQTRAMAQKVIDAQQAEIQQMLDWLSKHQGAQ